MEKLFLYKVYCYNKKLFILFLAFAFFTVFCNWMGFEITPFYVWGMYSEKEIAPMEYPVFRVMVNEKPVDYSTGYFPANRFFLQSPLSYYAGAKTAGDPLQPFLEKKLKKPYLWLKPYVLRVVNSQKEIHQFPAWYERYLQQTTGDKVKSLKVDVLQATYQNDHSITINSISNLIDEK
jgi:hypothetical protein